MKPTFRAAAAGLAVSGLALAGCAAHDSTSAGQAGRLGIATGPASNGDSKTALLTGTLSGSRSGDTACFWLDEPSGKRPIVWPHGWSARAHPLRVVDNNDRSVATVGQLIALGGGDVTGDGAAQYCPSFKDAFGTSGPVK